MHVSFQSTEEFSIHPTEPLKRKAQILQYAIYIPPVNVAFFTIILQKALYRTNEKLFL